MAMGDLQAVILGAVQRLSRASAREVLEEVWGRRLAYTTVNTVLGRPHEKGMVKRVSITGRGGTRYTYSPVLSAKLRVSVVNRALDSLVSAFSPSVVPTIYNSLDEITKEEDHESA